MARTIETVAVIGLGSMGTPLARHLAAGGFRVTGYDIGKAARERAVQAGIALAASPADVARGRDLVIIAVGFDAEVEDVLFGADGVAPVLEPGQVVAVASTVAPSTMRSVAARAASSGASFLDIPSCRGEQAAIDGKLLIMGGGDAAVFEACRPAIATFADTIHYLGSVGAGQVGKLVNNMILWAAISANHEGLKLGAELGVETEPLRRALVDSSAGNWALATRVEEKPMPWAEKDMTIVLAEADKARVSLPLSGTVKEVIKGIKIAKGDPMPGA